MLETRISGHTHVAYEVCWIEEQCPSFVPQCVRIRASTLEASLFVSGALCLLVFLQVTGSILLVATWEL